MIDFQLFSALVTYYFIMFATPGPNNAMLTASGLKFGNLTSQYSQTFTGNFSGQNSGQGREGDASYPASKTEDETNKSNAEISVERSDSLINLQA